jgi:hypothetical protein
MDVVTFKWNVPNAPSDVSCSRPCSAVGPPHPPVPLLFPVWQAVIALYVPSSSADREYIGYALLRENGGSQGSVQWRLANFRQVRVRLCVYVYTAHNGKGGQKGKALKGR